MSEAKIAQILAIMGAVFEQTLGESNEIKAYVENIAQTSREKERLEAIRESEKRADEELIALLTLELEKARSQQEELIIGLANSRSKVLRLETENRMLKIKLLGKSSIIEKSA